MHKSELQNHRLIQPIVLRTDSAKNRSNSNYTRMGAHVKEKKWASEKSGLLVEVCVAARLSTLAPQHPACYAQQEVVAPYSSGKLRATPERAAPEKRLAFEGETGILMEVFSGRLDPRTRPRCDMTGEPHRPHRADRPGQVHPSLSCAQNLRPFRNWPGRPGAGQLLPDAEAPQGGRGLDLEECRGSLALSSQEAAVNQRSRQAGDTVRKCSLS